MNNEKSNESRRPGNVSETPVGSRQKRRKFVTKAGMIVPAILVAKSRSSLAGQCLSPSASASINLLHSREDRSTSICTGGSPGYWKNQSVDSFPFLKTRFNTVFSPGFTGELTIKITGTNKKDQDNDTETLQGEKLTIQQVIQLAGAKSDPDQFAAHMAAAWCNLAAGFVPPEVLNLQELKTMWRAIKQTGAYSPTHNVTWSVSDVKFYLVNSTFDR